MERQVFLFDIDGHKALGFDTGLDSRAFARAKFAQFITEPGFIIGFDGLNPSVNLWKAEGVVENSSMVVWGPPFSGESLDLLLHDGEKQEEALVAIRRWIQAVLALGERQQVPLWPCAALIDKNQPGGIFFAPLSLALHCIMVKDAILINNKYVHPDSRGMNAAAFTAAAMLYRVFTGSPAFPAGDEITLHEDMREGNFLPIRLAVPGLDDKLAALIQKALNQNAKKGGLPDGKRLLEGFLEILRTDPTAPTASFVSRISETDKLLLEKEKTKYLKTNNAAVNTRRFVKRNAALLLGSLAAVIIIVLSVNSVIKSRSALSTANMEPVQVIESYYNAFGKLDHPWMEACVINGAGKDDINMVMNLFIISKIRQAYEYSLQSSIISANEWLEAGGGQVNFQVFGVTDLRIAMSNEKQYWVEYTLWIPGEAGDEPETGQDDMTNRRTVEYLPPQSLPRTDFVTLEQKKGNWRISEIRRVSAD